MPIPDAWEHLQSTLIRVHNRIVREEFSDIELDDDDITTPRSSLRAACLLQDADSAIMTVLRYWLFYVDLRKAQDLQAPIYGIPIAGYQESRKFRPQIELYFQEDHTDIERGFAPVTGCIRFRLMHETSESLTESEVRAYAQKVRNAFAPGSAFVWHKGKVLCSYTDVARGYKLQLLCRNHEEGRRVIEQVLDIQGHSPDWEKMNTSENASASARYPSLPRMERILGKSRRLSRARPVANVRFKYAALHIWGLPTPILLIDLTGTRRGAILRTA